MKLLKRVGISILSLFFFVIIQGQSTDKKALIHYMGWFGEGISGRHWSCGQAHTPLIGYSSSLSWATQLYHILLSWSCGIDGLVINVKDDYDEECMKTMVQTLKHLYEIDHVNFKYDFSISYDDQGLSNIYDAEEKFIYLRDYILTEPIDFLEYNGTPAVFAFNYPNEYLTAEDYHTALNNVFSSNTPMLIWNQIETDALGYANSFYPWVQPGGTWNGTNWGEAYLDWFYPEISGYATQLDFATGGVWAGFDDRLNTCWSWDEPRWIDRRDGWVYNKTWEYVNTYSGELPLNWVVIETWNDWNEGTEIEPSIEYGYKYLVSTINNINTFKGSSVSDDTVKFETLKNIYFSADSIEKGLIDSVINYPMLKENIASFIRENPVASFSFEEFVKTVQLEIFPNPAESLMQFDISIPEATEGLLNILDLNGCVLQTIYTGFLPEGNKVIEWDSSSLSSGMYICSLKTEQSQVVKRIVIL